MLALAAQVNDVHRLHVLLRKWKEGNAGSLYLVCCIEHVHTLNVKGKSAQLWLNQKERIDFAALTSEWSEPKILLAVMERKKDFLLC